MSAGLTVRWLMPSDLAATLEMWVTAWQAAYPAIDFAARRDWFAARIAALEGAGAMVRVAVAGDRIIGLLIVNPATGYLDQLVVAPEHQGRGVAGLLLEEARSLVAKDLTLHVNQDNARAIRFYEKHGFVRRREDINPRSGAPTYEMVRER